MTDAWHERPEFWTAFAPAMFTKERFELAKREVDRVLALIGDLPSDARILDLGCGPGRHTLELARRGFEVLGVDRTRSYIEEAINRRDAEGLEAELIEGDMRTFRREGAFDLAVNLFSTFGFFEDPDDDQKVLENVVHSLRPGGRFVMELMGKEVLARTFTRVHWAELPDGSLMLEDREIVSGWGSVRSRWLRIAEGERYEDTVVLRLYAGTELERALFEAGFSEVTLYGNLNADPYDHEAQRLVALAVL